VEHIITIPAMVLTVFWLELLMLYLHIHSLLAVELDACESLASLCFTACLSFYLPKYHEAVEKGNISSFLPTSCVYGMK
jgi:hypothetical protein